MKFTVKDAMGKMQDRKYFTSYHAEQMVRALNLSDATHYAMYFGSPRFSVEVAA